VISALAESVAEEGRGLVLAGGEDAGLGALDLAADLLSLAEEIGRW
jgi:hypothetical protein